METENSTKLIISTFILTFAGILSLILNFFQLYDTRHSISMAAAVIYAVFVSGIFSTLFVIIKRVWIVWIGIFVFVGLIYLFNPAQLSGGFVIYINDIIDKLAAGFDTELWYMDATAKMLLKGQAGLKEVCYIFMGLFCAGFACSIAKRKVLYVPIIISLIPIVLAVLINSYSSGFAVMYGIVYCLMLAIMLFSGIRRNDSVQSYFSLQTSAIVIGIIIITVSSVILKIRPENTYTQNSYFSDVKEGGADLYEKFKNGELEINKIGDFLAEINPFNGDWNWGWGKSSSPNQIAAGRLGNHDTIVYSGEEVLRVTVPDIKRKLYIKGYIARDYKGRQWEEPEISSEYKDLFDYLYQQSVKPQEYTSNYIKNAMWYSLLSGYYTTMKVEYTGGRAPYQFAPIYSLTSGMSYEIDGGYGKIDPDTEIEFVYIDESEYPELSFAGVYDTYSESEEKYREYVYNEYLDVNTTMEEELYDTWNGYSINNSRDRYNVALMIRDYLAKTCSYTLSPGKCPDGKDFVEYFLKESHEGYCTYFATAAVMMFRSAGIPARYVEGYSFNTGTAALADTTDERVQVDYYFSNGNSGTDNRQYKILSIPDSAAHAWVEYYVDGVGWLDFDVTPGNYDVEPETHETETPSESASDKETIETTEADTESHENVTGSQTDTSENTENTENTETGSVTKEKGFSIKITAETVRKICVILLMICIAAGIFFMLKIHYKKVEILNDRIYNMNDTVMADGQISQIWDRFIRLMHYDGIHYKENMTPEEFAKKAADEHLCVALSEALKLAEVYEKETYSEESISKEECMEATRIICTIRKRMMGHMGIIKKAIFKYVLRY